MVKIFAVKNMIIAAVALLVIAAWAKDFLFDRDKEAPQATVIEAEPTTDKYETRIDELEQRVNALVDSRKDFEDKVISYTDHLIAEVDDVINNLEPREVIRRERADLGPVLDKIKGIKQALRVLTKEQIRLKRKVKNNSERVVKFTDMLHVVDNVPEDWEEYGIYLPPGFKN